MLLHFILFGFCVATSIAFKFDDIKANATVGTPFTLTWYLDESDDPDKLHLKQRLTSQNSGDGTSVSFSFPNNGTHDGTVPVTFKLPGDHLVEAFQSDSKTPIAASNTIGVSNSGSGTNPSSISTSASSSTSLPITITSTSSAVPTSSTSPSFTYGDSSNIISLEPTGSSSTTDGISTSSVFSSTLQTTSPTTPPSNMTESTIRRTTNPGSTTTSESSVSPSSSSNRHAVSSSIGSPPKTPLIVGATVGSFVFLLLLLAALVYTLRRRQLHRKQYPPIFHRDRMVRKRSNASFSPLTPTAKDPDTYTNFADVEKHASYSSTYKEDPAPSPQRQQGCLEYSLPAPLAPRSETPSPIPAHTDRQMEIYDVLMKKNTDLIRLKTELRRGGEVQEEIEGLKATITRLEEALVSPWALGYTDEMPHEGLRALVPTQT